MFMIGNGSPLVIAGSFIFRWIGRRWGFLNTWSLTLDTGEVDGTNTTWLRLFLDWSWDMCDVLLKGIKGMELL